MQSTRIRNAAARALRRGGTRALDLTELARLLAEEERITVSPEALAGMLSGDDAMVLLAPADPIGDLPLVVHEAAPGYHAALGGLPRSVAVIDAAERATQDPPRGFDALALPLLQVWRDAAADTALRGEVTDALGGLYALLPVLDEAQLGAS